MVAASLHGGRFKSQGFVSSLSNLRNSSYKSVANLSARNGYRPDLREAAVARVSAIRKSQRTPKPDHEKKLRGNKAKKAAEEK